MWPGRPGSLGQRPPGWSIRTLGWVCLLGSRWRQRFSASGTGRIVRRGPWSGGRPIRSRWWCRRQRTGSSRTRSSPRFWVRSIRSWRIRRCRSCWRSPLRASGRRLSGICAAGTRMGRSSSRTTSTTGSLRSCVRRGSRRCTSDDRTPGMWGCPMWMWTTSGGRDGGQASGGRWAAPHRDDCWSAGHGCGLGPSGGVSAGDG